MKKTPLKFALDEEKAKRILDLTQGIFRYLEDNAENQGEAFAAVYTARDHFWSSYQSGNLSDPK